MPRVQLHDAEPGRPDRAVRPAGRPLADQPVQLPRLRSDRATLRPVHRHLTDTGSHRRLLPLRLPLQRDRLQRLSALRCMAGRVLHVRKPVRRHRSGPPFPERGRLRVRAHQDGGRGLRRQTGVLRRAPVRPQGREWKLHLRRAAPVGPRWNGHRRQLRDRCLLPASRTSSCSSSTAPPPVRTSSSSSSSTSTGPTRPTRPSGTERRPGTGRRSRSLSRISARTCAITTTVRALATVSRRRTHPMDWIPSPTG